MKTIFYGIYFVGAFIGAVCALALEPAMAAVFIIITPLVLMTAAMSTGRIRFHHGPPEEFINPERMLYPALAAIDDEDLSDQEAFERFGHQIALELMAFRKTLTDRMAEVDNAQKRYEEILRKAQ